MNLRGGPTIEATIACNILNRMAGLGRPESFAIGS
jgi:hypothetical protein